jgi:hypothetical protein
MPSIPRQSGRPHPIAQDDMRVDRLQQHAQPRPYVASRTGDQDTLHAAASSPAPLLRRSTCARPAAQGLLAIPSATGAISAGLMSYPRHCSGRHYHATALAAGTAAGFFHPGRDKFMTIKGYFDQPSFSLPEVAEEKQCN